MKLDNIVYDIDSLRSAIIESWSNDSPTFSAMYPSETTTALANVFAGYGAFLQYFVVSTMANCYTDTAFSREGIYQLAVTLGNVIHGNNSAQVLATLTKTNLISMNLTIPAETSFVINGKKYFNPHGILLPAGIETVKDIVLLQGEVLEVTKTTSGIPYERFYFSSDFKANQNYIKVYVNGEEWSVSDNFLDYEKNYVSDPNLTKMLVLRTDSDGRSFLKVGDGQLGNLPVANSTLLIHYVSNDGEEGNTSEIGLKGSLENPLTFTDSYGNQEDLKLEVVTTSTSYGGFGTQSLETLRMTSPWVYASGHRAVRRQDYVAMLDNQCGYLTSNAWGEYEQANKAGAYDSIMMNMVYYTGLKSFESYPYSTVGYVANSFNYEGEIGSNRGFYGSYALKISNKSKPNEFILVQDTGAKGFLFINDNNEDPRDSLLPDWQASLNSKDGACFISLDTNYIVNRGINYKIGDVVYLGDNANHINLSVLITQVDETGGVEKAKLQQEITNSVNDPDDPEDSRPWIWEPNTTYIFNDISSSGNGSNLAIQVKTSSKLERELVRTNDDREGATNSRPITNARSNISSDSYYESLYTPSLLQPVQIIIDYSDLLEGKGIAGVKFQATPSQKFMGTFAMYGTALSNPSFDNIRNSEDWTRIIDRTDVERPGPETDYWTKWYPTSCLNGEKDNALDKYHIFVIEFYTTEETAGSSKYEGYVHIDKMKLLYEKDCSYIDYANNGKLNINFPTVGSPGPTQIYTKDGENELGEHVDPNDESYLGFLKDNLLNEDDYLLYKYKVELDGLTIDNGYKTGNVLAYTYSENGVSTTFLVTIANAINGNYIVTVRNESSSEASSELIGSHEVNTIIPLSLDDQAVYTVDFQDSKFTNNGSGYEVNDIVQLNGTDSQITLKVTGVNTYGAVLQAVFMNNILVDTNTESVDQFIDNYFNDGGENPGEDYSTSGGSGSGLTINVTLKRSSGDGNTLGEGGTILISSDTNIEVSSSFVGNRIDTQDINYLDQPIIEKYNHFTTYMEFVQPKVKQVSITIEAALSTTAAITSNMIIQDIKNNINKLFEVTPDYLGKGLKLSDIYTAVMSTPNVNWCKVLEPVDNIDADVDEFLIQTYTTVNEVIKEYK